MTKEEAIKEARRRWPKSKQVCVEETIAIYDGIEGWGSGGQITFKVWGMAPDAGDGEGDSYEAAFANADQRLKAWQERKLV